MASERPVAPLETVQKLSDTPGSLKVLWSAPPFKDAQWTPLSAGQSRDKKRIKISQGEYAGRLVYRFHRNTVQLGQIFSYFDPSENSLWYLPDQNLDYRDAQSVFVGAILGGIISFSGALCLHASAVEYADSAILFLGRSGTGKSTTALNMCQQFGCRFITDDISVISSDGGPATVSPGYQKLRVLREDVARAKAPIASIEGTVYTDTPKAYFSLNGVDTPSPIKTIVSLDRSQQHKKISIRSAKGVDAFMNAIPHIYSRESYVKPGALKEQTQNLQKLISQSQYIVMDIPDDRSQMADICEQLLEIHSGG